MDFKNYDKISDELSSLSIDEALKLIKNNLISLGINHDNFVSEKSIVLNKEVIAFWWLQGICNCNDGRVISWKLVKEL